MRASSSAVLAAASTAAQAIAKRGVQPSYTPTYTISDAIEMGKSVFRQVLHSALFAHHGYNSVQAQAIIRDSISGKDLLDALNILITDTENAVSCAQFVASSSS